jgi:Helix-turn-helix domain
MKKFKAGQKVVLREDAFKMTMENAEFAPWQLKAEKENKTVFTVCEVQSSDDSWLSVEWVDAEGVGKQNSYAPAQFESLSAAKRRATVRAKHPGKKSQETIILEHMRDKGSISVLEAIGVYRIFNLTGRIADMRIKHRKGQGPAIHTEMKSDSTGKTYASYSLAVEDAYAAA